MDSGIEFSLFRKSVQMRNQFLIIFTLMAGLAAVGVGAVTNAPITVDLSSRSSGTATSNGLTVVSMESLDDTKRISPGDLLSFRVIEDREDPKQIMITELGEIEVPYMGRYVASNKTCRTLAQEIKTLLERDLYYKATVIITLDAKNRDMFRDREPLGRVLVMGAVRNQGVQAILPDDVLTISKAILGAGGFSDFANKKRVRLTRVDSANTNKIQTIYVNVDEIMEKGKTQKDIKLEPGDRIFVPSRLVNF
jgi:polysaccharide export outer membrane protein